MSAYISMFNFTEQGLRGAKNAAKSMQAVRQAAEASGGRVIGMWWTLGQYDGFVIFEAPDDEVAARMLIGAGMQGDTRSMTMRCFSEEEIERIVGGLP